jgi:predicted RNase H-like HicB family nuclease
VLPIGTAEHSGALYCLALACFEGRRSETHCCLREVPQGYIGFVEELPGANTQAATLDEARANLAEAVDLVLDANRALSEEAIRGRDVVREPLLPAAA